MSSDEQTLPGPASSPGAPAAGAVAFGEQTAAPPPAAPPALAWEGAVPPGPPVPPDSQPPAERYPMRYDVAYQDRLSRWKTLFRLFLIIPAAILAGVVGNLAYTAMGVGWIAVFFRRKYPRWLFVAVSGALGFVARSWAYALLQTDRYPSFDPEGSPVTLVYEEPPQGRLSRWRVLFWKLLLVIPHLVVLYFLAIAVGVVTVLAWFAILFTGRYPRGMFGFVTGVSRWWFRVVGFFASFNDRFPPFALSAEAGPGSRASAVICGVLGILLVGGVSTLVTVAAVLSSRGGTTTVDYAALRRGEARATVFYTGGRGNPDFTVALDHVTDPDSEVARALGYSGSGRAITFVFVLRNRAAGDGTLHPDDASLVVANQAGKRRTLHPDVLSVDGLGAPAKVEEGNLTADVRVAFVLGRDEHPVELRFSPPWNALGSVRYLLR
ncbi:MAG: DUF4389 domain-containing protein [Dehalococcoidia bacterium]|nr:DUF4389 domain-containing protein [Dehalococcoidia bacterium]